MIFDTHAHYDDKQFDEDRDQILSSMQEQGIGTIVDASATVDSWERVLELTRRYSFVYGMIGVHPDEVGDLNEENFARMEQLLHEEKIVAVGEIGLDYYWDKEQHEIQKEWFICQLQLARKLNMPVNIHSREAAQDTMEIMKEHAADMKAIIHCYSYSKEMAEEYVKMGYLLGIGGVVTFKNAKKIKGSCKSSTIVAYCFGNRLSISCTGTESWKEKCIFESDLCGTDNCGVERNYYGRSDCCDRRECKKILWLR